MVEIEDSTTCIYTSIRLLNVLRSHGACRDTTGGCRAFVVLHAVVGVNEQHLSVSGNYFFVKARDRDKFTGACRLSGKLGVRR